MRRFVLTLFCLMLLSIGGAAFLLWGTGGILTSGPHAQPVTIIIPKHTGIIQMAKLLVKEGALMHPVSFLAVGVLSGQASQLKAGEYLIPPHATPMEIALLIAAGKTVVHSFTIAEGLTSAQVISLLNDIPILTGTIPEIPEEGTLLPETYQYSYGEARNVILDRMKKAMSKTVAELWAKRAIDLPINSPKEALILASIVEKETGVALERGRVAAVFINRLRVGMRLQSDPTVIYGITKGLVTLERDLTRQDLGVQTSYNTYTISGLPPTPIACPGKAAIAAVLNPVDSDDLYFVANGTGGHTFSKNLGQHNVNVRLWRQFKKENKANLIEASGK